MNLRRDIRQMFYAYAHTNGSIENSQKDFNVFVNNEIYYSMWAARENGRLPEKWRKSLMKVSRRRAAWERATTRKENARDVIRKPVARKPRIAPAPTRNQINYALRKQHDSR